MGNINFNTMCIHDTPLHCLLNCPYLGVSTICPLSVFVYFFLCIWFIQNIRDLAWSIGHPVFCSDSRQLHSMCTLSTYVRLQATLYFARSFLHSGHKWFKWVGAYCKLSILKRWKSEVAYHDILYLNQNRSRCVVWVSLGKHPLLQRHFFFRKYL